MLLVAALTPVGGSAIPGGDDNGSTAPNISGGSGSPAATSAPFVNEHGQVCTPVGSADYSDLPTGDMTGVSERAARAAGFAT